uniref:Uncharacterized protein n=1 Tax=Ciona intestinalis TaxID=7719 RepID=H2XPG5_CIOIN
GIWKRVGRTESYFSLNDINRSDKDNTRIFFAGAFNKHSLLPGSSEISRRITGYCRSYISIS